MTEQLPRDGVDRLPSEPVNGASAGREEELPGVSLTQLVQSDQIMCFDVSEAVAERQTDNQSKMLPRL